MRLSFPAGEHDDILIGAGETSIGSADDNTIVLASGGVAAHHARLSVGERGIVLTIPDGQARTHVNMRPVREKAILRLGDIVSLDTVQFVLKPDSDASVRTELPPAPSLTPIPLNASTGGPRIQPARVLLRGLGGAQFGQLIGVRGRLVIGRGPGADLVLDEPAVAERQAAIETTGESIYLRGLANDEAVAVNGVAVRSAILYPGDQVVLGRHRFLIEAPGLKPRAEVAAAPLPASPNITQMMKAIQLPDARGGSAEPAPSPAAEANANRNDIWWLIGAAALIAAGLALLFWVRF